MLWQTTWEKCLRPSMMTSLRQVFTSGFAGGKGCTLKVFGTCQPIYSFPGGPVVKNLPAKQEMWVWSSGQEDPLEKGMATHSSTFAWEISWTEEPGGLPSTGLQRVQHDLATKQQQQYIIF